MLSWGYQVPVVMVLLFQGFVLYLLDDIKVVEHGPLLWVNLRPAQ